MRIWSLEEVRVGRAGLADSWVKSRMKRESASPPREKANKMTPGTHDR